MVTFSREVRSLFATCACVNPVERSLITCHCLWVSIVPGGLNLVNYHANARYGCLQFICIRLRFVMNVIEIAYVDLLRLLSRGPQLGVASETKNHRGFSDLSNGHRCRHLYGVLFGAATSARAIACFRCSKFDPRHTG